MDSASPADEIEHLKKAIAALEAQRDPLGDAVVDAALKPLRRQLAALSAFADERKRVTVLFADVSGFTALSEHLDPEDVTRIMNRCFEGLSAEVGRYGGTVDKYSGDAVMALFGAPQALENHEEMAVRAALAMQRVLQASSDELEREWGFQLRMRIGLNTGQVLAGLVGGLGDKDYTVMGDVVNLASRLEHACPVGRVMISAATARPLHPLFDLEPPQQITVKGKAEPVTVYLVVGPRAERGRARGLTLTGLSAPMIGRDQELARLQAAYRRSLQAGRWGGVGLVGEAGIGKTRLRREFLAWIVRHHPQIRLLTARCYAHTQTTPYHLMAELVQALFGVGREDDIAAALPKLKSGLQKLDDDLDEAEREDRLGSLAALLGLSLSVDPLQGLEPRQRRQRIFLSLERVLIGVARSTPLVLVTEDLHWADDVSLAFLDHLLDAVGQETRDGQAALLLAVSRPPDDFQTLLQTVLRRLEQPPYQTLALRSLDPVQSSRLVAELFGQSDLAEALGSLVAGWSQGNPFFVEEFIRSLMEDGTLIHDSQRGGWRLARPVADLQVPAQVQDLLAARLDRLPPEEKRVAQHAAIVGRTFWQQLLAEIVGQRVKETLSGLEERQLILKLGESQLTDDWEWLFRHVLMQEVAYASVTRTLRRSVHRQVAQWLEAHAGDRIESWVPLIAYHYERAEATDKALHYLTRAAQGAARAFDNRKVVEFCSRALNLADDDDDATRYELLRIRQEAYGQLGEREAQWADLQVRLELAERLDDDRFRAQALNTIGLVMTLTGRSLDDALARLERALALFRRVEDRRGEAICLNNAGVVHRRLGDRQAALAHFERALGVAREAGDRREQGHSLNNVGMIYWQEGDYSRALHFYRQALDVYREIGDRYYESISRTNVGEARRRLGHYVQALTDFEAALAVSRAIGDREGALYVLHHLGLTHTDLEQFELARTRHQEALALADKLESRGDQANAHYGLGLAWLRQGDTAQALASLERAQALHQELGGLEPLVADATALSQAHQALEDPARAREWAERALVLLQEQPPDADVAPAVFYQAYQLALGQPYLEKAHQSLMQQAGRISDAVDRRSFLENVPLHRHIVRAAGRQPAV